MVLLRSLLLTILAVLALSAPGTAAGFAALASGDTVAVAASGGDAGLPAYRPCEGRGGKGALPCQPDLGLPTTANSRAVPVVASALPPRAEPWLPNRIPMADPPPPRLF